MISKRKEPEIGRRGKEGKEEKQKRGMRLLVVKRQCALHREDRRNKRCV